MSKGGSAGPEQRGSSDGENPGADHGCDPVRSRPGKTQLTLSATCGAGSNSAPRPRPSRRDCGSRSGPVRGGLRSPCDGRVGHDFSGAASSTNGLPHTSLTFDLGISVPPVFGNGGSRSSRPVAHRHRRTQLWQYCRPREGLRDQTAPSRRIRASTAEGRPLPYVTAALGHASATTTLRHDVHLIDAARHGAGEPMADAVARARAELAESGVRPVCAQCAPAITCACFEPARKTTKPRSQTGFQ